MKLMGKSHNHNDRCLIAGHITGISLMFQVPVRWIAPESLRHNVYTHKSDVWSFGKTVWEILTFGARPYHGRNAKDVIRLIFSGKRLEQPSTATIDLYATLLQCELYGVTVLNVVKETVY